MRGIKEDLRVRGETDPLAKEQGVSRMTIAANANDIARIVMGLGTEDADLLVVVILPLISTSTFAPTSHDLSAFSGFRRMAAGYQRQQVGHWDCHKRCIRVSIYASNLHCTHSCTLEKTCCTEADSFT